MMPISENKECTAKPKVKQKNSHLSEPCDPNSSHHSKNYSLASNQTESESFNHFPDCESLSSGLNQSEKHFTNDESFRFKDSQSLYQTRSESINHSSDCDSLPLGHSQSEKLFSSGESFHFKESQASYQTKSESGFNHFPDYKSLCSGPSQSEKDFSTAKNIPSNSSQDSKQTKSESFNQSFDCCSNYYQYSQTEKNYSTTSQSSIPADYIPSVYALPISCSGNNSNIDSEVPSVIAPPKCNELTTLEENQETYDTKFKTLNNVSDCSAPCQIEKDFSIADSMFSPEEAVDYIPSVYALPISFSVANQTNNDCDFSSNIPPPILNAPKANQNSFPQKEENAIPSETNQSQIENSEEAANQILFKKDDVPPMQETLPFAASKVLSNHLQNKYTRLYTTNIHNIENDKNKPSICEENIANYNKTDTSVSRNKKRKKLAKTSPPIKTCDLFSEDYLNSLIELGSKSLKNSLGEPDSDSMLLKSNDAIDSLIELGVMNLKNSFSEPDCDSMELKSKDAINSFIELGSKSLNNSFADSYCDSTILKNEDAINKTPFTSFQEKHLNLYDVNRPKNDYVVECIKIGEQNPSVYICQKNSEHSVVVENVPEVFCEAKLKNERASAELKQSNMSVIYDVQSNESYNFSDQVKESINPKKQTSKNLQSMIVTSDLDHANQQPKDKISTKISDSNQVFFKMPSKSIDSGLGSLSQENLTISLSDVSEKLTDNSVTVHISNEDKFSAFLQNCSFDDEDLNEMERIDSVVDKFFDFKIY